MQISGDMIVGLYNLPDIKIREDVKLSKAFVSDLDEILAFIDRELPCPLGELGDKSRSFYEKHGYKIEYDPCDRKNILEKHLELNLEDERD